MKYINPKIDYAFKKIFGSQESKDILISFLNSILELEGENEINQVEILDPYQAPKIQGLKETFLDVRVQTNSGKHIIVEMQVLNVEGFDKRILYNLTKTYTNQIERGENYLKLNPVIAITITDFIMFDKNKIKNYKSNFILKEKKENIIYNGDLELVFIELPKFKKSLKDLEKEYNIQNLQNKEKWIFFIKELDKLKEEPNIFKNNKNKKETKVFEKAFDIASTINLSKEELEELEKRSIYIQDKRGMVSLAESIGIEKGREIGREEGIEIGREEGEKIGIEKGINLAFSNLIKSGFSQEEAKKILGIK